MQSDLFGDTESDAVEVIRLEQGELWYFPHWLKNEKAWLYFNQLKRSTQWEQTSIRIAGKIIPIPRLNAWYGEPGASYRYSGIKFKPLPYTRPLLNLSHRLANTLQQNVGVDNFSPNSALINLYRDGNDSVAWHADDEPELGESPQIASVSLGETRQFVLKPKNSRVPSGGQRRSQRNNAIKLSLTHGSLLLMTGDIQRHWLHCVPKERGITRARLNITFRRVVY